MFVSSVSTVIRRCLLPAAAVVAESKMNRPNEIQNQLNTNTCRPSELPIYTPDSSVARTEQQIVQQDQTPNFIENSVRSVRQTLGKYTEEFHAYEQVAQQSLVESKQNVDWLIDYLRQEDNTLPKAGAIGIGALTGLIFGLRGGFFKRTVYATTGALGMAAVCYPKEASEYTRTGAVEGKKYLTIAYNFIYGVKKDDPPLELPSLPKLPTSFSKAWDSVKTTTLPFLSDESAAQNVEEDKNASVSTDHPSLPAESPVNSPAKGLPGSPENPNT